MTTDTTSPMETAEEMDNDLDFGFDAEDFESETEPEEQTAAEGTEPEEKPEGEDAGEQKDEDFLTVKYNKAEKKLTREQAVELAQKGLNYDKILSETERLRGAVKPFADQAGMTVQQYLDHLASTADETAKASVEQQVEKDYPYITEDAKKEIIQARMKEKAREAESAAKDAEKAKWADALATYPDMADKVPQDVLDAVQAGKDPLTAMHEHRIAALQEQLAKANALATAAQKNNENRAASTGSMQGIGKNTEQDPFLAVWSE